MALDDLLAWQDGVLDTRSALDYLSPGRASLAADLWALAAAVPRDRRGTLWSADPAADTSHCGVVGGERCGARRTHGRAPPGFPRFRWKGQLDSSP